MSIANMAEKTRTITDADRVAASNLRRLWAARRKLKPSFTQEVAALELGMTQSAISQYLKCTVPLGLKATMQFASLLSVKPEEIRPDVYDLVKNTPTPFSIDNLISELSPASQQATLDFIQYKIAKGEDIFATGRASHYTAMIGKIIADLQKRIERDSKGKK